jgi:ribosomal protein RSM22 (predicted rRNA methylase)
VADAAAAIAQRLARITGVVMQLPPPLAEALAQLTASCDRKLLAQAAARLSAKYRQPTATASRFINSEIERLAYAATRMPATYAAARQVLGELRRLLPDVAPQSLLDLGAGAGAALWVAGAVFPTLRQTTLLERDEALIQLGRQLAAAAEQDVVRRADWRCVNLEQFVDLPSSDLIVCSYSLGELPAAAARRVVQFAWQAAPQILVIIEPGTIRGFATIKILRDELIGAGAHVVAPCPHAQACPLPEDDWCHFAARVERSVLQRQLKAGTLGYEDEKFAYIAVAKQPSCAVQARVLRHPLRQPGYTRLQLCAVEGLQQLTVTKRDKAAWKRARKTNWGDAWEQSFDECPDE